MKTIALKHVLPLTSFFALTCIALFAPLFHNQALTGPIVNATLFLGVVLIGAKYALFIGLLPSVIALCVGLLPPILAPAVPFIMLSNAVLIVVFDALRKHNFWLGVVSASLIKFLFLFSSSSVILKLISKKEIVSAILSWNQLLTALMGGVIAFLVLKLLKK